MGGETRQARTGLLVWSYREDFARSLCDERGVALTPGFFTGVRGTRSQTRALQMAREAARRAGSPLFAYMAEVTLSFPAGRASGRNRARGRHDNTFPWQLVDAGQGHMLRTLRDRVVRAVDPSFPTGPRALENLIGRSPALFFRRFFSCPLFSAVRMVSWTLPKDHGEWSGLPPRHSPDAGHNRYSPSPPESTRKVFLEKRGTWITAGPLPFPPEKCPQCDLRHIKNRDERVRPDP